MQKLKLVFRTQILKYPISFPMIVSLFQSDELNSIEFNIGVHIEILILKICCFLVFAVIFKFRYFVIMSHSFNRIHKHNPRRRMSNS